MLASCPGTFLKCYDPRFQLVVWVPVATVKSITGTANAQVWLKEPVPIGINEVTAVVSLFYDRERQVAGLPRMPGRAR